MSSRRVQLLVALAVAAVIAAVLVAVALSGGDDEPESGGTAVVAGQEQVSEMLDGVPQDWVVLGADDAPVTLVEYADIQCPHCAHFV